MPDLYKDIQEKVKIRIVGTPMNMNGELVLDFKGRNSIRIASGSGYWNSPSSIAGGPGSTTTPDIIGWSTNIVWTATDKNTAVWSAGSIKLANGTTYAVSSGNTGNVTDINYIYYDGTTTLKLTTIPQDAVGVGKLMVAVCKPSTKTNGKIVVQAFGTVGTDVFITAENIAANTITTNELAANSIDGMTITGALIRTASSGTRSQLSSNYFSSFDSTYERIRLGDFGSRLQFRDDTGGDCGYIFGGNGILGSVIAISDSLLISNHLALAGRMYFNALPYTNNSFDLGSNTYKWKDLYLYGDINTSVISFNSSTYNVTTATTTSNRYIICTIDGNSYKLLLAT